MQELWNDSFVLFTKLNAMVSQLSDEEAGQLFRAILEYQATGIVPKMDRIVAVVFAQAKTDMDYCKAQKDAKIDKNREAGKRSAEVRAAKAASAAETESMHSETVSDEHQPTPLNTVEHRSSSLNEDGHQPTPFNHNGDGDVYGDVNDDVKGDVYGDVYMTSTPHPPSQGGNDGVRGKPDKETASQKTDRLFEAFWSVYPKKVGKGDARKAFGRLKPSERLVGIMVSAVQVQRETYQWARDHGKFIPNPATWINQQRWLDEVEPDMGRPDLIQHTPSKNRFANFEQRPFDEEDEALGTAWLKKG